MNNPAEFAGAWNEYFHVVKKSRKASQAQRDSTHE